MIPDLLCSEHTHTHWHTYTHKCRHWMVAKKTTQIFIASGNPWNNRQSVWLRHFVNGRLKEQRLQIRLNVSTGAGTRAQTRKSPELCVCVCVCVCVCARTRERERERERESERESECVCVCVWVCVSVGVCAWVWVGVGVCEQNYGVIRYWRPKLLTPGTKIALLKLYCARKGFLFLISVISNFNQPYPPIKGDILHSTPNPPTPPAKVTIQH